MSSSKKTRLVDGGVETNWWIDNSRYYVIFSFLYWEQDFCCFVLFSKALFVYDSVLCIIIYWWAKTRLSVFFILIQETGVLTKRNLKLRKKALLYQSLCNCACGEGCFKTGNSSKVLLFIVYWYQTEASSFLLIFILHFSPFFEPLARLTCWCIFRLPLFLAALAAFLLLSTLFSTPTPILFRGWSLPTDVSIVYSLSKLFNVTATFILPSFLLLNPYNP